MHWQHKVILSILPQAPTKVFRDVHVASCCLSSTSCDFLGVTAMVNHAIAFFPKQCGNTWGSYGNSKRPGCLDRGAGEVLDGIHLFGEVTRMTRT